MKAERSAKRPAAMADAGTRFRFSGWSLDGGFPELIWLTVIFLLPLFFWPSTFTSFELPKVTLFRALTFILLVSLIFRKARQKKVPLQSKRPERAALQARAARVESAAMRQPETLAKPSGRRLLLPLILLGLTVASWVLSTVLSPAPAISFFGYYPRFQGLYTLLNYVIFSAVVFLSIENRRQIDRILGTIVASSLLVAVSAFLQSWGVPWLNYWDVSAFLGRFFGTMGHPDYLASFLVVVIPIQVERILANRGRLVAILALSVSLAALYFTLSRSAFLGLFIALLLLLVVACKKLGFRKLFIASLLTPLLMLTALVSVNLLQNNPIIRNNALLSRLVLKDENLRSVETRLVLWPAAARQILDSPFIGYGPDSFAITFPKYAPSALNTLENLGDYPDRAHNFLLDYAQQFGIPALLVFLAFLWIIFFRGLKFIFRRAGGWLTPLALICSLAGLLTANLFGFFVTVTWVYFWLILALFLRLTVGDAKTAAIAPAAGKPVTAGTGRVTSSPAHRQRSDILTLWVLGILMLIAGSAAVITQDVMLFAADISYRAEDINRAEELAPQISFYHYRNAELLTEAGNTSAAAAALERMGALTGYDGVYYLQKGILAERTAGGSGGVSAGVSDKAGGKEDFSAFETALQKMPAYAPAYLTYGSLLYKHGDYTRAAEILQTYLDLCPQYYLWKSDLGAHTPDEQNRYRIFYKLNPDFNDVFPMIADAYVRSPQTADNAAKAVYYKNLTFY